VTIERPAFEPNSGGWMRLAAVQAATAIGETKHFDKWRNRIGKAAWEHAEKTGEHRGVWVYAPGWFAAYGALRAAELPGTAAPVDQELSSKDRAEAIKLRNLELDLEERELRHAERKQEVLRVEEFNEILVSIFGGIGRVADRFTDEQKRMLADEMREARAAYAARFNGHSDTRITDIGRTGRIRSSGADRDSADAANAPRVRAKVRDHAPRRAKGKPKVP
jgi:hypothetical protein